MLNLSTDEEKFVQKATDLALASLTALELVYAHLAAGEVPSHSGMALLCEITVKANQELKNALEELHVARARTGTNPTKGNAPLWLSR